MPHRCTSSVRFPKHRRRARLAQAAEIEIAGQADRLPAGRLVSVGKVLDPQSRTLPITFAFENRTIGLPVGQAAFLHLLLETTQPAPSSPRQPSWTMPGGRSCSCSAKAKPSSGGR